MSPTSWRCSTRCPYDSLDLETPRFRLTLRRAPGGGWTEEYQVLAEPAVITPA